MRDCRSSSDYRNMLSGTSSSHPGLICFAASAARGDQTSFPCTVLERDGVRLLLQASQALPLGSVAGIEYQDVLLCRRDRGVRRTGRWDVDRAGRHRAGHHEPAKFDETAPGTGNQQYPGNQRATGKERSTLRSFPTCSDWSLRLERDKHQHGDPSPRLTSTRSIQNDSTASAVPTKGS